ncbi:recombinase family protein [Nitrosospira multiformis]|uniref:Site-specific DNA recombinase n=1 Tax=Nitrosospira multiformis TaxID=1231 RepID=A0A1I7HBC5_9PROT|nr:recombinase family protein [Nitrosospira multiformis]SFU58001.1 Site-specific DNA recombinase [Nitrosospira multiformis]
MTSQKIGYIRVSSLDQNPERQLDGIPLDKIFTDKVSAKDTNRPQLQAALDHVRAGDTLIVHSMDRLARNVEDMLRLVREMNIRGVSVQFIKENMNFTAGNDDPRSTLMFTMLSAFAQFERSLIKERQREGITLAETKGVYKGRRPALTTERIAQLRERAATKLAKEFGISRETVYQYIRTKNEQTI